MAGKGQLVKEQIVQKIVMGEYPLGEQLPPEPDLAHIYNVSRGTVRKVLGELEDDGIISRRTGAGTFVMARPKTDKAVAFTQQVKSAGLRPRTAVLSQAKIMANVAGGRVCEGYMLDAAAAAITPLYRIDRLRYANDIPLARQTIYLLVSDFKDNLLTVEDFTKGVFDLYHRYHRTVAWADEIIKARPATPEEVELLQLPESQFLYVRERISYDQDNRPLEVMTSVDRRDFFDGYRYRIRGEGDLLVSGLKNLSPVGGNRHD
ncbi:MAG: GntR family transcriptional regulator [Chloroflexi bacterium]|nr:GntR family transcriptional regulator [Chloroflexota bacterium]MBP8057250.1 GntR family transcriptional regulator [Chloroflexota bacterium]